ncbi:S8 family peptidase [Salininema proteolyticum]|uniref:S8 family peptidase n=1 Tax=Salininema proteolyticum TaxID=1607685 RepID=A0ABV8U3F9_9ACTN
MHNAKNGHGTRKKWRTAAVAGSALAVAAVSVPLASNAFAESPVEILGAESDSVVEGRYIAVLDDRAAQGVSAVTSLADDLTSDVDVNQVYSSAVEGFSFSGSLDEAEDLAREGDVAYVEAVQRVKVSDTQENPPNWGSDRLDQRELPLDDSFTRPDSAGEGVTAYVLDTGINPDHEEFGDRAEMGPSFAGEEDSTDCHGHGTHVAGTVAGERYGVAPEADVVGVQVLDCSGYGTTDNIVAAVDWVATEGERPAVLNMSLGGPSDGTDQAYSDAIDNAIAEGVTVVVAAGNEGDDACGYAPARFESAITVGNSTDEDARYTGRGESNYGECVDVFAPGTDILSARHDSDSEVVALTGTSMASPHVAGVAALVLGEDPSASPDEVRDSILDNAIEDALTDVGEGSPNLLANTEFLN